MAETKRLDLKDPWHSQRRWREQVEKRLQQAIATAEGSLKAAAARQADLIEMIADQEKRIDQLDAKIEKVRTFLAEKFLDNGGDK